MDIIHAGITEMKKSSIDPQKKSPSRYQGQAFGIMRICNT